MDLDIFESSKETDKNDDLVKQLHKSRWRRFVEYIKNHKAGSIVTVLLIIGLVVFGIGFYSLRHTKDKLVDSTKKPVSTDTTPPVAAKTYDVLDGLAVDPSVANRHPLAIIVENQVDARPQSGLSKASLVYEAFAEGGITRFLALFSSFDAEKVGPVRSIRTYFLSWASGYNAYIAHVGGNIDALDQIKAQKPYDLDQFAYSGPYWREYSAGLASEHTMYTSTTKLYQKATDLGYSASNNFTSYKFKDDPTAAQLATAPDQQKININYLSASYNVYYQYDKATNSYKRYLASKPQIDKVAGSQLNPKNLIVMTVPRQQIKTRINEDGYNMTTVGSGKAQIFLDGKVTDGTWKKTSATSREVFYDATGAEITFNRGQFWISVIPPESNVTVQ